MKEKEVEKQLNILQREIAINGEELEALWRNQDVQALFDSPVSGF